MTTNVELAAQCGAISFTPPPLRAVRGVSLTYEQLDDFAERICSEDRARRMSFEPAAAPARDGWVVIKLPEHGQDIEGKSSADAPAWEETSRQGQPLDNLRFWWPRA